MEPAPHQRKSIARASVLVLLFIGGFWFVWPTPYEYTKRAPDIYRVNRFTGVKEVSTSDGWERASVVEQKAREEEEKRQSELQEAEKQRQKEEEDKKRAELGLKVLTPVSFKTSGVPFKLVCSVRYLPGRAAIDLRIDPENPKLRSKAVSAVALLRSSSGYWMEAQLTDDTGFVLTKKKLVMTDFVGIEGDDGKVASLTLATDIPITEDEYKMVAGFDPTFVWPD